MIPGTKTHTVEPDITVVELSGHLNLGNNLMATERLIKDLITQGARKLAIDVSKLVYIDSSGIGMLVSCNGQILQAGGQMRVAGAQGTVAKVFETVHMQRITTLDVDLAASCAAFSAGSASA